MGTPTLWDRIKWFIRDVYLWVQSLRYETVPFGAQHGEKKLVDLDTVPYRVRMDYTIRNENILWGRELCERCEGTGNELFFAYRQCTFCEGRGYNPIKFTGENLMGKEIEAKWKPVKEDDDHITMEEYIEWIETGCVVDYDGFGYYATDVRVSDLVTRPSDLENGTLRKDEFSHVVWFNR